MTTQPLLHLVRSLNFLRRIKPVIMKFFLFISLFLVTLALSSCGAIETIFKAGMWWAFILMAIVVGVILWVVARVRKK